MGRTWRSRLWPVWAAVVAAAVSMTGVVGYLSASHADAATSSQPASLSTAWAARVSSLTPGMPLPGDPRAVEAWQVERSIDSGKSGADTARGPGWAGGAGGAGGAGAQTRPPASSAPLQAGRPTVAVGPTSMGATGAGGGARRPAGPGPLGLLPAGWVYSVHAVDVGGLHRVYYVLEPADLRGSVPLVVLLHGHLMTPGGILSLTGLARTGEPAVMVLPTGWDRSWDAGGCCGAAYRAGVDDVDFIRLAVAQTLLANPAADPSRVYAVGFSNGGRMAYRLACDLPGMFAGFAAVEAVPVQSCGAEHPADVTIVAQQADPLLSVSAGQPEKTMDGNLEPTVAATVSHQAALDGCIGSPTVNGYGQAVAYTWACAAGKHLTYVWYPGGAHDWRRATPSTPGATAFVLNLISH